MAVPLFTSKVIAVVWDFDQTLIPGYQQAPIFEAFGIDAGAFWEENKALPAFYGKQGMRTSSDTTYLSHLLNYVKSGSLSGLTNSKLREFGGQLEFYPGMPEFLDAAREHIERNVKYASHEIVLEHYIVSNGLREVIAGSAVASKVKDIWACEFIEEPAMPGFLEPGSEPAGGEPEISQIGYVIDNTTKTRAVWEINKGCNVSDIDVNALIAEEDRRVPLPNMLYVADGPSDIPVFSILNQFGGRTLGVYNPASDEHFEQVKKLSDQGRVQHFVEADYREGKGAYRWILRSLTEMAERIVLDRERALADRVGPPATHVVDE